MNEILADMSRHNHWANLGLIDFCRQLPDAVMETNVPGTYGTIRETSAHLAGAEERYLRALTAIAGSRPVNEESRPDLATLREHLDRSGASLIAYAETVVGDPILTYVRRAETQQAPASLFLVQTINHATEHRAQIMTAVTQGGSTPPDLDGWMWDEERRAEQP